jgi:hypothetical protein
LNQTSTDLRTPNDSNLSAAGISIHGAQKSAAGALPDAAIWRGPSSNCQAAQAAYWHRAGFVGAFWGRGDLLAAAEKSARLLFADQRKPYEARLIEGVDNHW